ncbi:MAG: hypothetical protein ACP5O2_12760 [Bacteroidales bacterium]
MIFIFLHSLVSAIAQPGPGGNSWGGNVGGNTLSGGSNNKLLKVKLFLEGPFNGTQMNSALYSLGLLPANQPFNIPPWNYAGTESVTVFPPQTVDWVLVDLRDAPSAEWATPATRLPGWPKAFLLNSEGYITGFDGYLPGMGNPTISHQLFIVIRTRTHVDVMSASGLGLSNDQYVYDFTDNASKAYGGLSVVKNLAPGVYGLMAGDADADGNVFTSDYNIWSAEFGSSNVYSPADFDYDGHVFTSDFNLWSASFGISWPINRPFIPKDLIGN